MANVFLISVGIMSVIVLLIQFSIEYRKIIIHDSIIFATVEKNIGIKTFCPQNRVTSRNSDLDARYK